MKDADDFCIGFCFAKVEIRLFLRTISLRVLGFGGWLIVWLVEELAVFMLLVD